MEQVTNLIAEPSHSPSDDQFVQSLALAPATLYTESLLPIMPLRGCMRHFPALFLTFALLVTAVLTACGGGNGTPVFGNPASITVAPTNTSLALGTVENLNALVLDSKGTALFNSASLTPSSNVTFTSSDPTVLQVATNGLICAGQWDSLTVPVVCQVTGKVGQSSVTVTSGTVTSTAVTMFVHKPVARIDITGNPATVGTCISHGASAQLAAKVYSTTTADPANEITSTVGPLTFTPALPEVVEIDTNGKAGAFNPGQTTVVADIGGFRSNSVPFVVCPVVSINVHVKGDATATSATLDAAGTSTLNAEMVDKNNTTIVLSKASATSATAGLTWTSATPSATVVGTTPLVTDVVAGTTNDATVTASKPGFTTIVASCTPPLCNAGLAPVYSNLFTENTNGTTSTNVFVTGTDSTILIPISTSTNLPGATINLSGQPNSILIGPDGARAFLGSSVGLMLVDANALTLTSTTAAVTGKVLAVAPDGKTVAVSDTTRNIVFVGDATTGAFQVFPLAGVTAGAYSRDGFRLYLASPTKVFVITSNSSVRTLAFGATDVATYTSGAFGYFASGNVPVVATCDLSNPANVAGTGATLLKALPSGAQVLAAGTNVLNAIDVTTSANLTAQDGCPPNLTNTPHSLTFTGKPNQILTNGTGSRAFITNDTANLVTYDAANHTTGTIALTGATASVAGAATLDGTQLYIGVAGTPPFLHRIDLATNADVQQIQVSTAAFNPNLIAIKP